MSIPVPPRVVRRILCHPVQVVLESVLLIVVGVCAGVALVVQRPSRRRRLARLLTLLAAAFAADLSIIVGAWRLWLSHRLGRRAADAWEHDHVELLARSLHRVVRAAERVVGLRLAVDLDPSLREHDGPLLVLARHAGVGDSALIAYLLTHELERVPRVMLKRFLLWDAAVDLVLGRLGAYFLPPPRVDAEEREARLRRFAAETKDGDAMLVFPEGRNWTPPRWRQQVAESTGEEARWMRAHPAVLPPKAGGTSYVLELRPEVCTTLVAQRGLDRLHSVRTVWTGVPMDDPVELIIRPVPAPAVDDVEPWLMQQWAAIDEWARSRPGGVGPAPHDASGAPSPA